MRGADRSLVLVGFSLTVANGFVPLREKEERCDDVKHIRNTDDLLKSP